MDKELSALVSRKLVKTIRSYSKSRQQAPTEGVATFVRKDSSGTCWVRLPGADADTPVNGGYVATANPGDSVRYRIDGTRLTVTGNQSDPAVGSMTLANAIENTSKDFSDGIAGVLKKITGDIITIINAAASGGTIDASKLSLTNYLTKSQTGTAISNAISSAFDPLDSSSYVYRLINNVISPAVDAAISMAEGVLRSDISDAIEAIDVGGANLLNNTEWDSIDGFDYTSSSSAMGRWIRQDSYASVSYSNGYLAISSTYSGHERGYTQKVACEPSTEYILSLEAPGAVHVGIGSTQYPLDDDVWVADGKRYWRSYETDSNQTYLYVYMYSYDSAGMRVNRVKLEKATTSSDYSPSLADVKGMVKSVRDYAESILRHVNGTWEQDLSEPVYLANDTGIYVAQNRIGYPNVDLTALPIIKTGSVPRNDSTNGVTVPASQNGGYVDKDISFGYEYASVPKLFLTLDSNSTAGGFGDISIATYSVSKTGATVRLFNSGNTARTPGFQWLVIG